MKTHRRVLVYATCLSVLHRHLELVYESCNKWWATLRIAFVKAATVFDPIKISSKANMNILSKIDMVHCVQLLINIGSSTTHSRSSMEIGSHEAENIYK